MKLIQSDIQDILNNYHLYSICDNDGNIIEISDSFVDILGYDKKTLIGIENNHAKQQKSFSLQENSVIKFIDSSHEIRYFDTSFEKINDNIHIIIRKEVTEYVYSQRYCTLTGLRSRSNLIEYLSSHKKDKYFAILVNIEEFSSINEIYGGQTGNEVLKKFAKKLSIIDNIISYRLQGDEFLLLGKQSISKKSLLKNFRHKLNFILNNKFKINDKNINVRVTIGATYACADSILLNANIALKEARREKKRYKIFRNDLTLLKKKEDEIKLIDVIQKSVTQTENIMLYYQPIICNQTNEIKKYEVLVRLRDGNNVISPYFFIELSQRINYYKYITRIILKKSFEKFHNTDIAFSVNLAIIDIEDNKTKTMLFKLLDGFSHPQNITIEITETIDIDDYDSFKGFVKILKEYGAKISLDDFGTGYSNFSHLANLDFDFIKIDGQFIRNITDSKNLKIVKNIVSFAKEHNIKVIAEFVEDIEKFKIVKDLGIEYSQGYYFGEPKEYTLDTKLLLGK